MSTIKDVAALAGVSIGSVSNYLNGKQQRESTSKRIKKAMKQLNYHQNIIASGLKKNKTMSIGIVINQLTDFFSMSIVSAIETYVEKFGYSIIVCDYHDDKERFEQKIDFLLNRSIDAIIVFHQDHSTPMLQKVVENNIPIVAIDAPIQGINSDVVVVNNYDSSKTGVNYLINKGYKNIGIIAGSPKNYISQKRQRGYESALKQNGITIKSEYIWQGDYTIQSGYEGFTQLINTVNLDAIFIINYYMSLGAMKAYLKIKKQPKIEFLVYDHFFVNDIFYPDVNSIEQPVEKIGVTAGKLLINRLESLTTNKDYQIVYCNNFFRHT
ncbi:LacI family DNA-binding transcriptional regulator [Lactobacillus sp. ESL0225]|uniref:LacI family DNA-binding transcriptional regulator n=1 Tax=Lactobacillus sp. ESL0225 TaxID=2069351 RepID=UPI000EFC59B8|nr:LacI family DNA-binding transcriptional regulator [Lactobacillus sp. ESL0225]RMC48129.1 LacI family transcriptional regulator [Lactobacillus sp. ESL0225]